MRKVLMGLSLVLFATAAAAAAPVVAIGETQLQLGTSQQEVLRQLQPQFALRTNQAGTSYNIYDRGENGKSSGASLARIDFTNDKLQRVTRNVGTLQGLEASLAMTRFIEAFGTAHDKATPITVQTDVDDSSPTATTTRVYFRLPQKIVQLAVYQPKKRGAPVTVDITEQYDLLQ